MNTLDDFINDGHDIIEWLNNYFSNIENYPVRPDILPGFIESQLPSAPPLNSESFEMIKNDFEKIILPGITHWQHPGFHAYFPANNSFPSILAEMITAGLGAQCMKWATSPAATELEKVVMKWLQELIGLPVDFKGVIMDTASVSTLTAIITARERAVDFAINEFGYTGQRFRVYCSKEAHSSIDKAVRIAGIGLVNLVKVEIDSQLRMLPKSLEKHIISDIEKGYTPLCVVGAFGTTSTGAIDPIKAIGDIAAKYNLWFHIDAAYAGSALILPEIRNNFEGIHLADSFVFNPHKWLFTNFDCSAFFVKDHKVLTQTFSLVPEYLQTPQDSDIDYSNWGIQLGRRFRALKLWFVIRSFGVVGLQEKLRFHIKLGQIFEEKVIQSPFFEVVKPRNLNIVCFRYVNSDSKKLNEINAKLLEIINNSQKIYLSHTIVDGIFVLRFVCGQTNVELRHIEKAWEIILECAKRLKLEV